MLPLSNEEDLLAAAVHNGVTWEDGTSTQGLILMMPLIPNHYPKTDFQISSSYEFRDEIFSIRLFSDTFIPW